MRENKTPSFAKAFKLGVTPGTPPKASTALAVKLSNSKNTILGRLVDKSSGKSPAVCPASATIRSASSSGIKAYCVSKPFACNNSKTKFHTGLMAAWLAYMFVVWKKTKLLFNGDTLNPPRTGISINPPITRKTGMPQ